VDKFNESTVAADKANKVRKESTIHMSEVFNIVDEEFKKQGRWLPAVIDKHGNDEEG
jgi:hypothetical protein